MEHLTRLRQLLQKEKIEALLVTNPVNVVYLSGFTGTAGMLLITEQDAWLLTDFRYLEQAEAQAPAFTVTDTAGDGWKRIAELLGGTGVSALAVEADHLTVKEFTALAAACADLRLQETDSPVKVVRRIKSKAEIDAIARAQALTDEAFAHLLRQMKAGMTEAEIALEAEFFLRRRGAGGMSFAMIVASGARSALPHGVASQKKLAPGDAVVLDFGCVVDGYCSDMTRTVFIGDVSDRQRQVYNAVLAAQKNALERLRAGLSGREGDALARDVLQGLGWAEYFGHGLGHGVGLEIHEAPRLSPAAGDVVLGPGMVVTVEPGVYFKGEFGIRIEDMVVITNDGNRNLTKSPKELFCI